MKKGFVISVDLMFAMALFTLLLLLIQSNSEETAAKERENLIRETAYMTASDCLLVESGVILSGNAALINTTLGNCTGRRTNVYIQYYPSEEKLIIENFEGERSISSQRLLTILNQSNATEFLIAALEVET